MNKYSLLDFAGLKFRPPPPRANREPLFTLAEIADRLGRSAPWIRGAVSRSHEAPPVRMQPSSSHGCYYSLRDWKAFVAKVDGGEIVLRKPGPRVPRNSPQTAA